LTYVSLTSNYFGMSNMEDIFYDSQIPPHRLFSVPEAVPNLIVQKFVDQILMSAQEVLSSPCSGNIKDCVIESVRFVVPMFT